MFRQVFNFVISIFSSVFSTFDSFMLDNNISLLSFFLFLIFARITLHLISFIKNNIYIENDSTDEEYKKFRRYK